MKTEVSIDRDNWLNIKLSAETVQEASQLVQFAMNANADARHVADVFTDKDGVSCYVSLKTRRNPNGDRSCHTHIPRVLP